jgi:hypothetical protein
MLFASGWFTVIPYWSPDKCYGWYRFNNQKYFYKLTKGKRLCQQKMKSAMHQISFMQR